MSRWGTPRHERTQQDRTNELVSYCFGCRPHMLDAVTVDQLVSRYGTTRQVAEYHLTIARQKRASEPREVRA